MPRILPSMFSISSKLQERWDGRHDSRRSCQHSPWRDPDLVEASPLAWVYCKSLLAGQFRSKFRNPSAKLREVTSQLRRRIIARVNSPYHKESGLRLNHLRGSDRFTWMYYGRIVDLQPLTPLKPLRGPEPRLHDCWWDGRSFPIRRSPHSS